MEIIKFDRVVSVNSEIQGHGVQNILDGEISPNKNWMCEKGTDKAVVILQLERAVVLMSIHVGNAHSAFVEVLVGRAADSSNQFESLIPMSTFMNLHESKTGTNPNRTRFFNKEDFNESAACKAWDRIKVVCSQPFNKHVPFGLCFLKVHGEKGGKKEKMPVAGGREEEEEIPIGSFFKKKRSFGGSRQPSVSEQIKEAEKESLVKRTPLITDLTAKMKEKLDKAPKKPTLVDDCGVSPEAKRKKEEIIKPTPKKKKLNGSSVEKKAETKKIKEKKKRGKPFSSLMDDVVLVISGFKNPLRGNIRGLALEMGAKYSADWEPHCTHLVCAYGNTPKFNQVKGKGKIVKREWVEKCHADKRRYPWRRFALDKSDLKNPESEEEVEVEEESESEEQDVDVPSSSGRREEDEEKDKSCMGRKSDDGNERKQHRRQSSDSEEYDVSTDEDEYEKQEKRVDTSDYPMPYLPNMFSSKTFYVDPNLKNKPTLERYIIAYNGILTEKFNENVDFYVTEKGGAVVEVFRKTAPNMVAVKPSWIWEANSKQKHISPESHLVK